MPYKMSSDVHTCPAPDCSIRVPNRLYACRFDWYRLPAELKQKINETARMRILAPERRDALTAASQWYRDNPRAAATEAAS